MLAARLITEREWDELQHLRGMEAYRKVTHELDERDMVAVRALGERIGYGRLMMLAAACWRDDAQAATREK